MTQTEKIAEKLTVFLNAQQSRGVGYVDLTAGELGKMIGVYNKTPLCVAAMKQVARKFKGEILHDVPSGYSTTTEIRYHLNECKSSL